MNKELQNKAWAVLPREFKEEVKALYAKACDIHNIYTSATCINNAESRAIDIWNGKMQVIKELFGASCLPDEVAHVAKEVANNQKFLVGEKVVISDDPRIGKDFRGRIGTVVYINSTEQRIVDVGGGVVPDTFHISHLVPYTESQQENARDNNNYPAEAMKGIIINGKVYEAVLKRSQHCSDCDLYEECVNIPLGISSLCVGFCIIMRDRLNDRIIFRFSKELTEKIRNDYSTDVEYRKAQSPWIKIGDRKRPMPNDKPCLLLLEDGTVVDDRSDLNDLHLLVLAWMPIPSFDEILEDNKDVRTGQPCGQGIREHGK